MFICSQLILIFFYFTETEQIMRVTACHFRRCIIAGLFIALLFCVVQVIRIELGFNEPDMSNLNKL